MTVRGVSSFASLRISGPHTSSKANSRSLGHLWVITSLPLLPGAREKDILSMRNRSMTQHLSGSFYMKKVTSNSKTMETETTHRPISTGTCESCGAELAKNKMTQHLKFCKQRLANIAAQEGKSRKAKTRLLHILAEGRYNPQYWLHFEVPASESLWTLDQFLKAMWIDDLDHLSGFTINGTNYSTDYPDEFFSFHEVEEAEEEEISEEEQEKELRELVDNTVSELAELSASFPGS